MNILAVDSSKDGKFSIAALQGKHIILSKVVEDRFSEAFFPTLLSIERKIFEEVNIFVINVGPGSYTGIRAGIAALNGMAVYGNRKVVGVDAFSAILHKSRQKNQTELKNASKVSVLVKGYNDSFFYLQEFKKKFEEKIKPVRIPMETVREIETDILLSDIPGCGEVYEILAEDLALMLLEDKTLIKDAQTVTPLYIK